MQIPYCDHPEVSEEKIVWAISHASWRSNQRSVSATRDRDVGRALEAGPYPHVFKHPAEVQRRVCDRVCKREKCCSDPQANLGQSSGNRAPFLVARILCKHGRLG